MLWRLNELNDKKPDSRRTFQTERKANAVALSWDCLRKREKPQWQEGREEREGYKVSLDGKVMAQKVEPAS